MFNVKNFLSHNFFFHAVFILMILFSLIFFSAMVSFFERRILALLQNRYGPNRVGKNGFLQLIADMIKIFFKEDWIPPFSDKFIFILSPIISFLSFLLIFSIIPITKIFNILNINIGILFFLMVVGLSVYSVLLASWSSNSKYALLGGIRSVAQMLSYEIFMGISLMGVVAKSGSFNLFDIVYDQRKIWNVFPQFIGFLVFFIAALAVCHRHPFDQPESEQELVAGYHTEYSGIKFGLFFIGEYISIVTMSAFISVVFFGGGQKLFFFPSILSFFLKTFFFIFLFILLRASLPRPRYDKLMIFGWSVLFPLSVINLLTTASIILYNIG